MIGLGLHIIKQSYSVVLAIKKMIWGSSYLIWSNNNNTWS